jgi:hypothetical protein
VIGEEKAGMDRGEVARSAPFPHPGKSAAPIESKTLHFGGAEGCVTRPTLIENVPSVPRFLPRFLPQVSPPEGLFQQPDQVALRLKSTSERIPRLRHSCE